MSRFGRVSGAFKPDKVRGSKTETPGHPNILNVLMCPEKKTPVKINVAVVGTQTGKAIWNLSPSQRFNDWITLIYS